MTEKLPWYEATTDPGPSFVDLLRRTAPHLIPSSGLPIPSSGVPTDGWMSRPGGGVSPFGDAGDRSVPHGTTVVCIRYASGVLMAGDRRATEGHSIASRTMEKVYAADQHSAVAIAGAAGPAMEMVRVFQLELEHYEKIEGQSLSLEGKANKLSQMVRANLPAAFQGLVVVPLFAGFDLRRERGRVFRYDITGGRYEEADYATTGSGGVHARNWIKAHWREGLTSDEVADIALASLFQAADEDSATGGPDLMRRIYPMVALIDVDGFRLLDEPDLAARSSRIVDTLFAGGSPS